MDVIQEILLEYQQMRGNGLDAKSALQTLRPFIEPLDHNDRASLAKVLRQWEQDPNRKTKTAQIARVQAPKDNPNIKKIDPKPAPPEAKWMECDNCGRKNQVEEVFCYSCGQLLGGTNEQYGTQMFKGGDASRSPEEFTMDSILVLKLRDHEKQFELRPQNSPHELVIGRSSGDNVMAPDLDLNAYGGAQNGVSRLHMSIQYDMKTQTIQVHDLGSGNGSFINGQKLIPKEQRILRNEDELRLGRFVLKVYFQHPGNELS